MLIEKCNDRIIEVVGNQFIVDDSTDELVRVFVVQGEKGEKGDPGDGGRWGEIVGNIQDQTDLQELISEHGSQLLEDLQVSNALGRYTVGDVIDKGTALETIFRGILSKTYYPTLTDPSLSLSYGASTLVKVGKIISAMKATLNFNRGRIDPQYTAESSYRSGEATQYLVSLTGANIQYSDNSSNNQFNIPAFTREFAGKVILNASVNYSAGVQPKDSDGEDYGIPLPEGSKSTNMIIEFILPFYWGKSNSPDITTLVGATEDLSRKGQKAYRWDVSDEYMYIAYDAAYGNLTHITDELNMENITSWQRSEVTFEGQNYIVYRSGFSITGSPLFTFKF